MIEEWKDIEGYEGLYQVSNLGRVKSVVYNKEKILKPFDNNYGYLMVKLWKDGERKTHRVHRLVLKTFNPIEGMNGLEVNHIDENKTNNHLENLEWCDRKYNSIYGTKIERFIKSISISIYCLERGKFYSSIKQASEELNIKYSTIMNVLKGRQKQAKGYTFRYTNQILYIGGQQ